MAVRRCPNCRENNPPEIHYCQDCGTALGPNAVVISQDRTVVQSKRTLPASQLKRLGASVAIGAIALIAEVGILYIRRRKQHVDTPLLPNRRRRPLPAKTEMRVEEKMVSGKRTVTIFSERVVEERRWGRPMRRIVDRLAWRSEETIDS